MSLKIPANTYWALEEFLCEQRDLDNSFEPVLSTNRLVDKARIIVQGKLVEVE